MDAGDFTISTSSDGTVTAVDARSARSFARHSHEEFGIGAITAGAQRSWSGRGPVEAGRGDLITVNPAEVHDGHPIDGERRWSMLYLAPDIVDAIVVDATEGARESRELHHPVVSDARLARLFIAARRASLSGDAPERSEELLLMLLGALIGAPTPTGLRGSPRLARVRQAIDDDPASPHALADLAVLAGLSRFGTVRAFARMTGLTPHAYLVQRRLDLARRLVRAGTSIAAAAAEAGFADQSHLHRLFTARHGFTPGAYAAALRQLGATSFKNAPLAAL